MLQITATHVMKDTNTGLRTKPHSLDWFTYFKKGKYTGQFAFVNNFDSNNKTFRMNI